MKPRPGFNGDGNTAPDPAPGAELPEGIKEAFGDLNADELLALARELERRASLILAHLGLKPTTTRSRLLGLN